MEKDLQPESMATVQMKPDYPPSEIYSTSEPPPAYRNKPATSIQIARIVAFTIVVSSFVLGAFILASSYVTARAGCQQLDQLDAMLDKELILESRDFQGNNGPYYPQEQESIPVAHALHQAAPATPSPSPRTNSRSASHGVGQVMGHPEYNQLKDDDSIEPVDENKLQSLSQEKSAPSSSESEESSSQDSSESSHSDSSDESDESDDVNIPFNIKLPLQRDLDEVAKALLMNSNLRSSMGCVVERHRAEEFGLPSMSPLAALLGGMDPRRRTTGERIAIICESGDEPRRAEPHQPQMVVMPMPGPMRYPHPPPPPPSAPEFRGMPPSAPQPALQPPPAPRNHIEQGPIPAFVPQEMRIHVQRVIAIPPPQHNQQQSQQQSDEIQMEQIAMPLPLGGLGGLAALGLTPADLRAIQRTVHEAAAARQRQEQQESIDNDMQEVKTIVNTLEAEARAEEQESNEMHAMEEERRAQAQAAAQAEAAQAQAQAHAQAQAEAQAQAAMQAQHAQEMEVLRQEDMSGQEMMGRRAYGRGLPVHIPVPMMVEESQTQQMIPEEGDARPHYVQPRSV